MKTLKILAIVAVTGLTGVMAHGTQYNDDCDKVDKLEKHSYAKVQMKRAHKIHPNKRIRRLLKGLDLSAEQKSQLKEIRKSTKRARQIQREHLKGTMGLRKFISVDGFDKEEFIAASENRAKAMIRVRADRMEKFIEVLTPEQRIELTKKLNRPRKIKKHQ